MTIRQPRKSQGRAYRRDVRLALGQTSITCREADTGPTPVTAQSDMRRRLTAPAQMGHPRKIATGPRPGPLSSPPTPGDRQVPSPVSRPARPPSRASAVGLVPGHGRPTPRRPSERASAATGPAAARAQTQTQLDRAVADSQAAQGNPADTLHLDFRCHRHQGGWSPAFLNWDSGVPAGPAQIDTAGPDDGIEATGTHAIPAELAHRAANLFEHHSTAWHTDKRSARSRPAEHAGTTVPPGMGARGSGRAGGPG